MEILPQLLLNAIITGSIYALAAAGLSLTYAMLRIINFAHGHMMMTGAYIFYFFWVNCNFSFALSLVATLLCSAMVGCLVMRACIQPFIQLSPLIPFVTTLALATILESLVSIFFGVNVKSLDNSYFVDVIEFAGAIVTPIQCAIIGLALLVLGSSALVVHRSTAGRRLRALSQNPAAAQALGIRKQKFNYWVLGISAMLAAVAGIMVGFETNLHPGMGASFSIKASAAMILGGLGNIWGTVAGSYLLGIIENFAIGLDLGEYSIPAGYKDAFSFIVILAVLLFRPNGIFTRKSRSI